MLGFLFGVVVGAAGYWAYRFWKGDQDTSWEQPYAASGTDAYRYGSSQSEAAGSSAATGAPATESGGPTPGTAP